MDTPLSVRYSKGWGIALLSIAGASALVCLLSAFVASRVYLETLIATAACAASGIAYLTRTYFHVNADAIVVKAVIGPVEKRYPLGTSKPVLRDGGVFIGDQKVRISRSMADREGWKRFEEWIAQRK